jgi:phage-related holin
MVYLPPQLSAHQLSELINLLLSRTTTMATQLVSTYVKHENVFIAITISGMGMFENQQLS